MTKNIGYLEGKVSKVLLFNAIPMFFGIISAVAFNLVDTIFIGQLGKTQLAAFTFTFPVVFFIVGITFGIGTGASAVISKAYGANNLEKVKQLTTDSLLASLIFVAIFISIGLIFFDSIFELMGADPQQLPYIKEYMRLWYPGVIFLVVPLIGNSALRAIGETRAPSMIMMVAVVVNLILDPILIFGWWLIPSLGMTGAALATIISRFFTLAASYYLLTKRYNLISFKNINFDNFKSSFIEIMKVGLPTAAVNILMPLGFALVTNIISKNFGEEGVAALGAASRVETLALVVFMALGGVLGPFIGQNYGANKYERIFEALKSSYRFSIIWGVLMVIFFYFFGEMISRLMQKDSKIIYYMLMYFSIIPFQIAFRGFIIVISTTFNVLKRPLVSAFLAFGQMFILFIPLAYILVEPMGFKGIFIASLISSIIVTSIGFIWLRIYLSKSIA